MKKGKPQKKVESAVDCAPAIFQEVLAKKTIIAKIMTSAVLGQNVVC